MTRHDGLIAERAGFATVEARNLHQVSTGSVDPSGAAGVELDAGGRLRRRHM